MKRVKVAFEVDRDALKELISAGKKGAKKISDRELDEMAKRGVIHASDFLSASQERAVSGWVSKASAKATSAIKNPKVQKAAISGVVAVISVEGGPPRSTRRGLKQGPKR